MANYTTSNLLAGTQQNLSSSNKTILNVLGAASSPRRGKIYDFMVAADGTPADNALTWNLLTQTANDGTKTTLTPTALDPADAAATTLSNGNFTAEGTVGAATTSRWAMAMNQRSTYRWVAAPGSEIVWAATANTGYALVCKSAAYASTVAAIIMFQEQ